ncbi:MAG: hypothetical protein GDA45_01785 [Chromatiales bacterium]|nr:hypothetical protein [Chromatiales bacterium]
MSIPLAKQLRLPILKIMQDGKERHKQEIYDLLDRELQFSEEDKTELLASGGNRLDSRKHWAIAYLKAANLLENMKRGYYKITSQGQQVLKENPSVIDRELLLRYAPADSNFYYPSKKSKEEIDNEQNIDRYTAMTLPERLAAFFEQTSAEQATNKEVVEWIVKNYPVDCAKKAQESTQRFEDQEEWLIRQIGAELGSLWRHPPNILKEKGIIPATVDRKWGWRKEQTINASTRNNDAGTGEDTNRPEPFTEKQMYPKLIEYLKLKLRVHSKRIDETRSANLKGPKGNQWLYPDIVGLENLSKDWDRNIKDCVTQYSDKKSKLWSFEVKKAITSSNLRETFFQAVSNSSWANFGYLVATEIAEGSSDELRILSSLHGIGFIKLNTDEPSLSQILIPAKEKTEIDWNIANRLAKENSDFREYIDLIIDFCKTGRIIPSQWD